jgi:uncharacterized protein (DUF1810 family)
VPDRLSRFVEAQEGVYERALQELRRGRKATHWMWFVFPQLAGLGHSEMARRYGISSLEEAQAYLRHPVLGPRLRECTAAACGVEGRSAYGIFGSPDDLKFRSSMTLFLRAGAGAGEGEGDGCFREALDRFFAGGEDPLTLSLLGLAGGAGSV